MRFIPTYCVREGQILGKSLYNNQGGLLLKAGSEIKEAYIEKIRDLGFQGLYIDDEISRDLEIENVINDDLKIKSVQKVKNMFIDLKKEKNMELHLSGSIDLAKDIVDELIANKDLMVNMIDIKSFDDYTYYHSVNVAVLSTIMGISYGLNKNELYRLTLAALLHDVGKVFIDQELLNKNGKLTDEEFEKMKEHSVNGFRYLRENYVIPVTSYVAVLDHHEKYDGTGYPNGKKGKEICLFGRIIAIADVYDALTSERPYRKGALPANVMEYIMGGSGSHFDYDLVNIFVKKVAAYPIGTCVKLNNGQVGIVVENFSYAATRPKIRIIDKNKDQDDYTYINLADGKKNSKLTVVDVIIDMV